MLQEMSDRIPEIKVDNIMVTIKENGKVIAVCNGSDILGITAKEEAKTFIESYKKIFPKVYVNGMEV